MRPTSSILGASRLPLTPKRGNKDFYKGTRQSYVPGGGHRTGPPGKHVVQGKAKFRIVDEQVRIFVPPPQDALQSTHLKPYVSTKLPNRRTLQTDPNTGDHLPSFSPNAIASSSRSRLQQNVYDSILSFDPAAAASATGVPSISPAVSEAIARPGKPTPSDFRAFSKRWNRASVEQKQALTMEHRRAWWEAMVQRYPATQAEQV